MGPKQSKHRESARNTLTEANDSDKSCTRPENDGPSWEIAATGTTALPGLAVRLCVEEVGGCCKKKLSHKTATPFVRSAFSTRHVCSLAAVS